ncbi:hypothetical protein [Flaviaesturariibacter amylovorans]|uniref:Uncharacterized protein n=1 Tax=Flaviaesturariibacter amylovorans TaxID=1084520 RepID=A0ABP8G4N6_9BACT
MVSDRSPMKRALLLPFLLIAAALAGHAQPGTATLKRQLQARLAFLDTFSFYEDRDVDVDAYSVKTMRLLVRYLSRVQPTARELKQFRNFERSARYDDSLQLRAYYFGYSSGGTRGQYTHTVLQWRSPDGQLHAHDLSPLLYCEFHAIYPLRSATGRYYLLLGSESGNASTVQRIALVVRIDSNKLDARVPVFSRWSSINLPNAGYTYYPRSGVLRCDLSDREGHDVPDPPGILRRSDSSGVRALRQLFARQWDDPVCLRFNGSRFVRTRCPKAPAGSGL